MSKRKVRTSFFFMVQGALHSGQVKTGSSVVSSVTQDSFGEANRASDFPDFPKKKTHQNWATQMALSDQIQTADSAVDTQMVETFQGHGILKRIDMPKKHGPIFGSKKKRHDIELRRWLWRRRCRKHMWVLALCPLSTIIRRQLQLISLWRCRFNTAHVLINCWSFHDLVSHVDACAVESMYFLTCSECDHTFCHTQWNWTRNMNKSILHSKNEEVHSTPINSYTWTKLAWKLSWKS